MVPKKNEGFEFEIDAGPSKLDLMLSLFDTDMGTRTVKFHAPRRVPIYGGNDFIVQIVSVQRCNSEATIWLIEGTVHKTVQVSIYYLSDTREGTVRFEFEEEFETHGVMETPNDARRARALMNIIHRMVAIAQNHGATHGHLPNDFYSLFEKAKPISWAKDRKSLADAINGI